MPNLFDLIRNDEGMQELGTNLEDMLRGFVAGNTTDLLGFPIDAVNSALGAVGIPVAQAPVGGSDWLRAQFNLPKQADESAASMLGSLIGVPSPADMKALVGLGGIMMGPKSRTWNKEAEEMLQAYQDAGNTDQEIRRKLFEHLNVYEGADGKARQEIPDYAARLHTGTEDAKEMTLVEALDHPELFEAYPILQQVRVNPKPAAADMGNASFSRRKGEIPQIEFNPNSSSAKTDLLHEVQHAVQLLEGFPRGGTAAQMKESSEFAQLRKAAGDRISDENLMYHLYRRLAGEVESRLVEARGDGLPPELLRTIYPPDQESVTRTKQIIR